MKGLVSMKGKSEGPTTLMGDAPSQPTYPYGLCLHMEGDVLDKLGMAGDLPEVGEERMVMAKVVCTAVSQSEREGDKSRRSAEWQITDMAMPEKKKSTEEVLYKKG